MPSLQRNFCEALRPNAFVCNFHLAQENPVPPFSLLRVYTYIHTYVCTYTRTFQTVIRRLGARLRSEFSHTFIRRSVYLGSFAIFNDGIVYTLVFYIYSRASKNVTAASIFLSPENCTFVKSKPDVTSMDRKYFVARWCTRIAISNYSHNFSGTQTKIHAS